jgi:hypothetical protein
MLDKSMFVTNYSNEVTALQVGSIVKMQMLMLGAFAELRKTIISFVMFASPPIHSSVCPHGTTQLPMDEFFMKFYI